MKIQYFANDWIQFDLHCVPQFSKQKLLEVKFINEIYASVIL